jgi:hypothetical protein
VSALASLVEHAESIRARRSRRPELEELEAIRSWALAEVVGFNSGDEVEITEAPDCRNGWWPYREALAAGARASVESVTFSAARKTWYATIILRREWWTDDGGKRRIWNGAAEDAPPEMEAPRRWGGKHSFALLATRLKRVTPETEGESVMTNGGPTAWVVLWRENYGDTTDVSEVFAHKDDAEAYAAARERNSDRPKGAAGAEVVECAVHDRPVWDFLTGPAPDPPAEGGRL